MEFTAWTLRLLTFLLLLSIFEYVRADSTCPIKFGYFPDPTDCQGYYICTFGTAKLRKCGGTLHYQHTKQICDTATAECQQEGGQANRPKYTGLNMKTSDGAAAGAQPASNANQDSQPATTQQAPVPPPPTQSPSFNQPQPSRTYPMAGQDSSSNFQQQQPAQQTYSNLVTRRPYNFFHEEATTIGAAASEDKPAPTRATIQKPFKDADFGNTLMNKRPSFRPVGGRPTQQSPTTTSTIQMARPILPDNVQNTQKPVDRKPTFSMNSKPTFNSMNVKPSFNTAKVTQQAVLPPPPNNFAPASNDNFFNTGPQNPSVQAQSYVEDGQTQNGPDANPDDSWQPVKGSSKYSGNWQGQSSMESNSWPSAPKTGENPGSNRPIDAPNQNAGPQRPAQQSGNNRNSNPNMVPFMNAASQTNAQMPNQDVSAGKQQQDAGSFSKPNPGDNTARKPPVMPTESAMSQCLASKCQLPNCFCGGTSVPGGLSVQDAPQMVILSFDAEINERNLPIYEQVFNKNRKNPNGCNIKATFFVSHEFTNYGMVRYLYEKGHEIGSHSITHGVGSGFKGEKAWETEMAGQKGFLASFASIRPEDIRGARAPLLGPGGDEQFQALYNGEFLYDSTLVTPTSSAKPFWPYTLDFAMPHVCVTPPCPQRGYRGLWELPLNPLYGLFGESCYEADRCTFGSTGSDVYKLLYSNFYDRHYTVNKAPFHLAIHADWLKYPPHREAFEKFLDLVASLKDTWIVTGAQAIAWMQNPTPVSQLNNFAPWQCSANDAARLPQCDTINACPLEFRNRLRYFYTCSSCPAEFPWRPEV